MNVHASNTIYALARVSVCVRGYWVAGEQEGRVSFDELVQELCAAMPVKCLLKELIPGLILTCRDEVRALRDGAIGAIHLLSVLQSGGVLKSFPHKGAHRHPCRRARKSQPTAEIGALRKL